MPEPKYHSYLIRLWQEDNQTWRFVLLDLIKGQQRGFVDMEQLLLFLKDQVDALCCDLALYGDKAQQCVDSGADSLFEQYEGTEGFVAKED